MTEHRRLAAIVSADVAGYSRLMGRDESGTLAALKALRQDVVDPAIASHGGRIVKTTGDGLLLEFPSVVNAVRCAVEVQMAMADRSALVAEDRRIAFRVGINIGDIIVDGDDIFGDGVNIAARLQEIATPGGICISSRVHEDVRDRLEAAFDDGGTQTLKNIARPVHVWRWQPGATIPPGPAPEQTALPLPDKPSIAVLPFQNLSGDPEQEYFVDGMVEDITTALSRIRWLFVVARNSSFTYKGLAIDVRRVGRELGVRYVLEGSVRRSADSLRITAQLIEADSGTHLWADRFDGRLQDVFDLQDRVAVSVVGALEPTLRAAEIRRSMARPARDLGAYDYFLRALPHRQSLEEGRLRTALELLHRAIECDPRYGAAYGAAADCHQLLSMHLDETERPGNRQAGIEMARRAIRTGDDDPDALANAAGDLVIWGEDIAASRSLIDRALLANPSSASSWQWSGFIRLFGGETDAAIEHLETARRLSPRDPFGGVGVVGIGMAHFLERRWTQALAKLIVGVDQAPFLTYGHAVLAACHAHLGQVAPACQALTRLRTISPKANPADVAYLRRPEHRELVLSGLRLATAETP
jgi:adenylate cyclase